MDIERVSLFVQGISPSFFRFRTTQGQLIPAGLELTSSEQAWNSF